LTKQDEKLRLRRRLQDQAVDQAAKNRWEEAVETNLQLISLARMPLRPVRQGLLRAGQADRCSQSYQHALRLNSNNAIARKNVERLEDLLSRRYRAHRTTRQLDDRLFMRNRQDCADDRG
jgi:hypothetical protein